MLMVVGAKDSFVAKYRKAMFFFISFQLLHFRICFMSYRYFLLAKQQFYYFWCKSKSCLDIPSGEWVEQKPAPKMPRIFKIAGIIDCVGARE